MRAVVRSSGVILLVVAVAALAGLFSTITSAVALAATLYLVKGTNSALNQIPDSDYPAFADRYLALVGVSNPSDAANPPILVDYPAAFFPITPPDFLFAPTYDQSVAAGVSSLESGRPLSSTSPGDVLWGYSQGAAVVSQYKKDYNAGYQDDGTTPPVPPTYVVVANPNRPNGGILARAEAVGTIPVLGVTFDGATPTQTPGVPDGTITTYDIARQYDMVADAPTNPLNLVADVNGLMGFYYLHSKYISADLSNAIDQGTFGDTQYYLVPTGLVPLLMPLASVPLIGPVTADSLDPFVRAIVEAGYNRAASPGAPTPFDILYFPDPSAFAHSLSVAVPTGVDNGLEDIGGARAAGTGRASGIPDVQSAAAPSALAVAAPPAPNTSSAQGAEPADASSIHGAEPGEGVATAVPDGDSLDPLQIPGGTSPTHRPVSGLHSAPRRGTVAGSVDQLFRQTAAAVGGAAKSVTSAAISAATDGAGHTASGDGSTGSGGSE